MSKQLNYNAKMERLSPSDRYFIRKYKLFEEKIRSHDRSMFNGSLADHLQNIKHKKISPKNEAAQINEVLAFHDWVSESRKLQQQQHKSRRKGNSAQHDVSLPKILVSYADLFAYCKMRVEDLGLKVWSQSKLCIAILRMLQFMEMGEINFTGGDEAILAMKDNTRGLLAKAKRESDRAAKERPSVDELREQGKLLSFTEVAKVCQRQEWRVKLLVENRKRSKEMQQVIDHMLPNEVTRLAVISTIITCPMRKGEFEACAIEMTTTPWRLKLSAEDRKSGQSINNRLSREEMELFELMLKVRRSGDDDETWQPFKGVNTTEVLKATTRDIAGVPMTIMDVRTAAESYVDFVGNADIQNALSYAEGHTERIAKQYYKRNGSTTTMKPWMDHIRGLIRGQDCDSGNSSALDEQIEKRMEQAQKRFKEKIEERIRDLANNKVGPVIKRKARKEWTEEEDAELSRLVRVHGKGNWKDMLDDSSIMQRRFQSAPTVFHARDGLKGRWRVLSSRSVTRYCGFKRSADGSVIIHRRKKIRAEKTANFTEPKSSWSLTVGQTQRDGEHEAAQPAQRAEHRDTVATNQKESGSYGDTSVVDHCAHENDESDGSDEEDLSDTPRVAPEKFAWICDICNKAKFRTFEEAMEHENNCTATFDADTDAATNAQVKGTKETDNSEQCRPFASKSQKDGLDINVHLRDSELEVAQPVQRAKHRHTVAMNRKKSGSYDDALAVEYCVAERGESGGNDGTAQRRSWEYRYKELIEYQNKHGHCEVPRIVKRTGMTHSPLGKWVANQREYYKKYLNGQPSALTEAKVDMLNLIGFTWRVEKSRPRSIQYSNEPKSDSDASLS